MAPAYFVWTNLSIFAVAAASLLVMIFNVDPFRAEPRTLTYFFISVFFFISSIVALILYLWRIVRGQKYKAKIYMQVSVRQGILFSTAITGLLLLQSMKSLNWWDGLLLIASLFLIELYFKK